MTIGSLTPLIAIISHPGIGTKALSARIGVTTRHGSRIAAELIGAGLIERTGEGLHPAAGHPIVTALEELISLMSLDTVGSLMSDTGNLRVLSAIGQGSCDVEYLLSTIGCSRSSLYRMLGYLDHTVPGLVLRTGKRVLSFTLNKELPYVVPILTISSSLHPYDPPVKASPGELVEITSVRSRILVHLLDHLWTGNVYSVPVDVTQKGISSVLGTTQPVISRELSALVEDGLVMQTSCRVPNHRKREKTYFLTPRGQDTARVLLERVSSTEYRTIDFQGIEGRVPLGKIAEMLKVKVAMVEVMNHASTGNPLVLDQFRMGIEGRRASQFLSGVQRFPRSRTFVGRGPETGVFMDWLDSSRSILLVHGAPGAGKTAFLSHMASMVSSRWQVFQYTVNEWSTPREFLNHLAIFTEDERLKGIVDHRLDISPPEAVHLIERSMQRKRLLFMIDDCQRMDPRMEALFEGITKLGGLKIVLSGRGAGCVEGIDSLEIGGLDRSSACELMSKRGVTIPEIDGILSITGGNPLALELISGLDTRTYTDLETLIDNEIIPNLSQRDQEVLSFLSVLRYPFKPDVLGSLYRHDGSPLSEWERKRYSDRLEELARRSFLTYSGESYRMHDMLKDLFYRITGNDQRDRYHPMAAHYYLSLENDPARVEALHHMVEAGRQVEAMGMLSSLGGALVRRGFSKDLKEVLLSIDPEGLEVGSRIDLYHLLGEVKHVMGDWDGSISDLRRAIDLGCGGGKCERVIGSKLILARLLMQRGSTQDALEEYTNTIELANEFDQFVHESHAVRQLGSIMYMRGEHGEANRCYERAMEIAVRTRSRECLANAYFLGSLLSKLQGDFERSEKEMRASLSIYDELGDKAQKLKVINNLGWLYSHQQRWEEALVFLEDLIGLSRSVGDFENLGYGLLNSAEIMIRLGNQVEAQARLERAWQYFSMLDDKRLLSSTELTMAQLYKEQRDLEKAREYYDRAIDGYLKVGIINQLPDLYYQYGEMELECDDPVKAKALMRSGLDHARVMKDAPWVEKLESRLLELEDVYPKRG